MMAQRGTSLRLLAIEDAPISDEQDMNRMLSNLPFLPESLRLVRMRLKAVPRAVCDLVSLTILHLCSNQLLDLPSQLTKLIALEELNLTDNQLTFVASVCSLTALKRFVSLSLFFAALSLFLFSSFYKNTQTYKKKNTKKEIKLTQK